jgi:hypothetical protein
MNRKNRCRKAQEKSMTNALSIIAVAGAWLGGLGIIAAVASFCFGVIRAPLLRQGLVYLLVADVGLIAMLASLLGILSDATLLVFSAIGLVLLICITVAAFVVIRAAGKTIPAATNVLETTRQRIEF